MTTQTLPGQDTRPAQVEIDFAWWDTLLVACVFVASVAAGWW